MRQDLPRRLALLVWAVVLSRSSSFTWRTRGTTDALRKKTVRFTRESLGNRPFLVAATKQNRHIRLYGIDISSDSSPEMDANGLDLPTLGPSAEGQLQKKYSGLDLWQRRLITNEDPFGIHKWASVIYTLSSVVILGTGGWSMLATDSAPALQSTGTVVPDSLASWSMAFSLSNIIMCGVSVRMSFIHRKGDLTARNAFLGTAVSSLFSGFFYLWLSPFAPSLFDIDIVSQSCFGVLMLLNAYFILDTMVKIPEVVEGRRDRKVETTPSDENPTRFIRDALGYVLPIAWGLPVIGSTAYQTSFAHDRQWFLDYCQSIEVTTGFPFLSNVAYLQVLASLAASYGALFVTLRDKKLISKQQELVGITVFSVPAMLWTIWVTAIFYQNL